MNTIELKGVTKTFDGFKALDALDLTVPEGSVYGLVGPNGAGKTTAIRHMTGMLRPDAGQVLLLGEPVWDNTAVKARMACIPDEPWFFSGASTRDMMEFYRELYPRFDQERYEKLRSAFPLDEQRPIRRLSRGMRKQSAFWLALSLRPEVLILDEPVDGLDPVMRRQVWSLVMGDVAENGTSVLVSSHNLRELEDVCDRIGILQRGRCLLEKSVADLQETTVKFVLALPEGAELPQGLDILHDSAVGQLRTLILRGREEELTEKLRTAHPLFLEAQPLTLEEIFIYEMGGADYAVQDILL
jgi:ABC-2 type transport system ATP-binding protein